jgi:hypothetical protein
MKAYEFKNKWNLTENNLRSISLLTLDAFNLTDDVKKFLNEAGLPEDAAPFLGFVGDVNLNDKYGSISFLTDWFNFLEAEYRKYVIIGSDGSGDIIALDSENNCTVEWLDHEDYFSSRFMNSSIIQLANSLLVYREFFKLINEDKNEHNLAQPNFSDTQFEDLMTNLSGIDKKAVKEGFWKNELDLLLVNRGDGI